MINKEDHVKMAGLIAEAEFSMIYLQKLLSACHADKKTYLVGMSNIRTGLVRLRSDLDNTFFKEHASQPRESPYYTTPIEKPLGLGE